MAQNIPTESTRFIRRETLLAFSLTKHVACGGKGGNSGKTSMFEKMRKNASSTFSLSQYVAHRSQTLFHFLLHDTKFNYKPSSFSFINGLPKKRCKVYSKRAVNH